MAKIENAQQFDLTRKYLQQFQRELIERKTKAVLAQAEIDGIQSLVDDLERELAEWEARD